MATTNVGVNTSPYNTLAYPVGIGFKPTNRLRFVPSVSRTVAGHSCYARVRSYCSKIELIPAILTEYCIGITNVMLYKLKHVQALQFDVCFDTVNKNEKNNSDQNHDFSSIQLIRNILKHTYLRFNEHFPTNLLFKPIITEVPLKGV